MKIRDKKNKVTVDVSDQDCLSRPCYWPRQDPGVFCQGQGYRSRSGKRDWLCGTREINGCPVPKPVAEVKGEVMSNGPADKTLPAEYIIGQ